MNKVMSKISRFYFSTLTGIGNIIDWFPVIWRDRDFDEGYLYDLLYKKLDRMENFYRSDKPYVADALKTADEIKEVKDLLFNVMNNTYETAVLDKFDTSSFFKIEGNTFVSNVDNPEYQKYSNALDEAEKQYQEAKKKLFALMAEKIDDWWD